LVGDDGVEQEWIVADMGLRPEVAKVLFIVGRIAGLAAHYFEEVSTFPPMRNIDFGMAEYVGA
jgi:citrate synthase